MKRWVNHLTSIAENHLIQKGRYGDHMLPGDAPSQEQFISKETPPPLLWTGYYYRNAWIMAQVARILGNADDAAAYDRLAGVELNGGRADAAVVPVNEMTRAGRELPNGTAHPHAAVNRPPKRAVHQAHLAVRAQAEEIAVGRAMLGLGEFVAHPVAEAEGVEHITPVGTWDAQKPSSLSCASKSTGK
jgi:hypothetical protein